MSSITVKSALYDFNLIQAEARQLVERGVISRSQTLYVLQKHLPVREWLEVEKLLERYDYHLRDRIGELLASEIWYND